MAGLEHNTKAAMIHQVGEANSWRKIIVSQLQERNKSQTHCFYDLISLRKFLFNCT